MTNRKASVNEFIFLFSHDNCHLSSLSTQTIHCGSFKALFSFSLFQTGYFSTFVPFLSFRSFFLPFHVLNTSTQHFLLLLYVLLTSWKMCIQFRFFSSSFSRLFVVQQIKSNGLLLQHYYLEQNKLQKMLKFNEVATTFLLMLCLT